jgi:hypothetical protein
MTTLKQREKGIESFTKSRIAAEKLTFRKAHPVLRDMANKKKLIYPIVNYE